MTEPSMTLSEYLRKIGTNLEGDFLREGLALLAQMAMDLEVTQQIGHRNPATASPAQAVLDPVSAASRLGGQVVSLGTQNVLHRLRSITQLRLSQGFGLLLARAPRPGLPPRLFQMSSQFPDGSQVAAIPHYRQIQILAHPGIPITHGFLRQLD